MRRPLAVDFLSTSQEREKQKLILHARQVPGHIIPGDLLLNSLSVNHGWRIQDALRSQPSHHMLRQSFYVACVQASGTACWREKRNYWKVCQLRTLESNQLLTSSHGQFIPARLSSGYHFELPVRSLSDITRKTDLGAKKKTS